MWPVSLQCPSANVPLSRHRASFWTVSEGDFCEVRPQEMASWQRRALPTHATNERVGTLRSRRPLLGYPSRRPLSSLPPFLLYPKRPHLFTEPRRETVWKFLSTGQPPHHNPRHRRVNEGLSGGAQPFVVFGHPPVMADPREGALHHPPTRQHLETFRWHQPLPVHRLPLLGPLCGPSLGHLFG